MKAEIKEIYLKIEFIKEDGSFKTSLDTHAEVAFIYNKKWEFAVKEFFEGKHTEITSFDEFKYQFDL